MKVGIFVPRLQAKPFGMQIYIESLLDALCHANIGAIELLISSIGLRHMDVHHERLRRISNLVSTFDIRLPETVYEALPESCLSLLWSASPLRTVDILHTFSPIRIPKSSCRVVLTIQDVIPLRLNEGDPRFIERLRKNWRAILGQTDLVITISEFSKGEIIDVLGVPEEKIAVIPNGLDHSRFRPLDVHERASALARLQRLGVRSPYFLHIGGCAERKNVARLIEGFDIFSRSHPNEYSLVLAGASPTTPSIEAALKKCVSTEGIRWLPYLSNEDALTLLQMASALVFPSTYEGFGMPPLEAMACGTPVCVSNAASLPEVCGDSAFYFDPLDSAAIADAIKTVSVDPASVRDKIASGLARARKFSWEGNVSKTLEIYQKCAFSPAGKLT